MIIDPAKQTYQNNTCATNEQCQFYGWADLYFSNRVVIFIHEHGPHNTKIIIERNDHVQCSNSNEPISSFCAAEVIARRLDQPTDEAFILTAFQTLLATTPGPEELQTCLQGLQELGSRDKARPAFINTLLNHHDFITVR